jgi:predicted PurR-regulated permease PerM
MIKLLFFWKDSFAVIDSFLSAISPFLIGVIFALLMNPLVNWIRNTVLMKWFHVSNRILANIIAIIISYLIVVSAMVVGLIYIIPEIIASLTLFVDRVPEWADSILIFLNDYADKHPNLNLDFVISSFGNADSYVQDVLNKLVPSITSALVVTGVTVVRYLFNIIVAMIVSCYLLLDKKAQKRSIKRVIYAFLPEEKASKLCKGIRLAITTFGDFIDGKMIDSLIIGLLTFVCMLVISFFGIPGYASCALLVSIIVCVTNMIPYFGPFLGGIPCVFLLGIYSPKSGLIFAILILIIQQLDGNVIGPKILGDSTGLRPLWVIFAITLGGWLAGVAGMFLGVPCLAVVTKVMESIVDERLTKKQLNMPVLKPDKPHIKLPPIAKESKELKDKKDKK